LLQKAGGIFEKSEIFSAGKRERRPDCLIPGSRETFYHVPAVLRRPEFAQLFRGQPLAWRALAVLPQKEGHPQGTDKVGGNKFLFY
jgi:hypothetical protein